MPVAVAAADIVAVWPLAEMAVSVVPAGMPAPVTDAPMLMLVNRLLVSGELLSVVEPLVVAAVNVASAVI